jgi:hypothetical protein
VELLAATSQELGFSATAARNPGTHGIRGIGIEPLFEGSPSELQNLLPNRHFQGFQI